MTNWSTTTKHEPASINGGRKYELRDRVTIEQLNNMTENSFYAMEISDDANKKAEEALKFAQGSGTTVFENGQPVSEFNADKKADKTEVPTKYLTDATIEEDILTITKQDGSKVEFKGSSDEQDAPFMLVGSIFASAIPQTDARVHLLDGSTIAQTGVYETFANLIKALVSAGNPISCSQDEFNADVTATGNCGKFVIDNNAGTIRLPKITKFIQGLSYVTDIGKSIEAGLPNITGELKATRSVVRVDVSTGAFTGSGVYNSGSLPAYESGDGGQHLTFDASKSNAIYGKSGTVQPNSTQYPYYIVLASGYKSNQIVDIDNIINETNILVKSYSMMPSSKKIYNIFTNKEVGSYDYNVPANGWIMINLQFTTSGTANNGTVILYSNTDVSSTQSCPTYGYNSVRVCIPVSKGDVAHFNISGSNLSNIWGSFFIYAKGQEV